MGGHTDRRARGGAGVVGRMSSRVDATDLVEAIVSEVAKPVAAAADEVQRAIAHVRVARRHCCAMAPRR